MKPKAEAKCGSPGRASRSPRVPFSAAQIGVLEGSYRQTRYLSSRQVGELATLLGLSETQVKIWFQKPGEHGKGGTSEGAAIQQHCPGGG
ncbi:homeobox protein box-5-like [Dermochelys coriacea]|uniref:homeobox protein box-5-like n=1 Tax=Dermochelys coriacea TaxID=27794 RepID=UPI0018E7A039|nr:homeobox protein box-5-like [Dermochelys coriacea]XP_043357081.1 homeobox protein box-5-like [Dermochelys coriacea]